MSKPALLQTNSRIIPVTAHRYTRDRIYHKRGWFRLPMISSWLLMMITFNIPSLERVSPTGVASLDIVAMAKITVRLGVLVVMGYMFYRLMHHPKRRMIFNCLLPFILFISYAFISTGWSALKVITFGQSMSLLVVFLVGVNIALLVDEEKDFSRIIRNLVTAMTFIAAVTLAIYFAAPEFGSLQRDGTGILHPTNGAANAGVAMMLLWSSRLIWGWEWARRFTLPCTIILGMTLLIAANRMSVGLLTLLITIMIGTLSKRNAFFGLLFAISAIGTIYLMVDPYWRGVQSEIDKIVTYMKRDQTVDQMQDFSGRAEMWEKMWHSFSQSPVRGHGYFVTSKTGSMTVWYKDGNWTAHNMLMQVLVTTGIIGFTLFLWALMRPASRTIHFFYFRRHNTRLGIFLILMLIWFCIWSITNESIAGPLMPETVAFFTITGSALGLMSREKLNTPLYQ